MVTWTFFSEVSRQWWGCRFWLSVAPSPVGIAQIFWSPTGESSSRSDLQSGTLRANYLDTAVQADEDVLKICSVPKVNSAIAGLSSKTTLPWDDGGPLKDAMCRRMETSFRKLHISSGVTLKSGIAMASVARALWASTLHTDIEDALSCASCHATAGLCTLQKGYVTCSCISGYVGNGVNCTSIASCTTATCCSQGYYWDNRAGYKICTDINECADATLNKCVPSSTCANKNGIYLCGNTRNIACSSSSCPFDQDCLTVGGVVQCADPCLSYQLLNGTSRLSNITSTGVFTTDRYNFGWFRYNGTVGLRMQEGCVGSVKCGSAEPFTLNSSHPAIGQGVVLMPLLANSVSGCTASGTIPVKACAGGYYVYKFSGSLVSEVYCTASKELSPRFCCSNSTPHHSYYYYNNSTYYYHYTNHYHSNHYDSNNNHTNHYHSNHYHSNHYISNNNHTNHYDSNHYDSNNNHSNHYHTNYNYSNYHHTNNYYTNNYNSNHNNANNYNPNNTSANYHSA
ncbi:uncharacterized protein LOC142139893 [Mixophyes fleayi]|uniref:uncharacterized protein LOC142139893 n=1 Tax=Mixophyes fleayi TaxID=3061075 RepID=UPI003F4E2777